MGFDAWPFGAKITSGVLAAVAVGAVLVVANGGGDTKRPTLEPGVEATDEASSTTSTASTTIVGDAIVDSAGSSTIAPNNPGEPSTTTGTELLGRVPTTTEAHQNTPPSGVASTTTPTPMYHFTGDPCDEIDSTFLNPNGTTMICSSASNTWQVLK